MGDRVGMTPEDTWDLLINQAAEKNFLLSLAVAKKPVRRLILEYLEDTPTQEESRAFCWYLLYCYRLIEGLPNDVQIAMNQILGAISGEGVACGDITMWECLLSPPSVTKAGAAEKQLIRTWLQAKGLDSHATAIGL